MTSQSTFTSSRIVLCIGLVSALPSGSCEAFGTGQPASPRVVERTSIPPADPLAREAETSVVHLPFGYRAAGTQDSHLVAATRQAIDPFVPLSSDPFVRLRGGRSKVYRVTGATGAIYAEGMSASTSSAVTAPVWPQRR